LLFQKSWRSGSARTLRSQQGFAIVDLGGEEKYPREFTYAQLDAKAMGCGARAAHRHEGFKTR